VTDQRTRVAAPDWVSRVDPGNLLYGAIVATAALAVGAGRGETAAARPRPWPRRSSCTGLLTSIATVRERPAGSATPLHKLIWDSAKNESAILAGGMPAVIVASALTVAGISLWLSVLFDLGTDIVVLVLVGLLAGLRAGGARLAAQRRGTQRRDHGRDPRGAAGLAAPALGVARGPPGG